MKQQTKLFTLGLTLAAMAALTATSMSTAPVLAVHNAENPGSSDNAAGGLKGADQRLHDSGPEGGAAQDDKFHEGTNNAGFSCQGFFDNSKAACGGIE